MGFVASGLNQSYGQDTDTPLFGTYKNEGSTVSKLKSVTLYLGSADIMNFGTEGTLAGHNGNGSPIQVTLSIGKNSSYSSTRNVTTRITNSYSTSTGNYPDKSQCAPYTFTFDNSPAVQPGDSVNVYWTNRSSLTSSDPGDSGTNKGQILTVAPEYSYTEGPSNYTVTWDPNGGVLNGSSKPVVQSVAQGDSATKPANPTRQNYEFTGWSPTDDNWQNVQQNLTYTAQWELATAHYAFYKNISTSESPIKSGEAQIGDPVSSVAPSNPTRSGYTFYGWYVNRTDHAKLDLTKRTISATDSKNNFYAVWDAVTGPVTFYMNTSSSDTDVFYEAVGVEYINKKLGQVKKSTNPTRPGYRFEGWSLTRTGQVESDNLSLWNSSTNKPRKAFYAIWSVITGPVTFYRNYDSSDTTIVEGGSKSDISYISETLGSIKPSDPTQLGHKFLGWALSRTGSVKSDDLSLWDTSENKPITAFYAIWEKLYTVWVRVNGTWVKKLNVRKYNASSSTWDEMPPKKRSDGKWDDEWDDKL